MLVTVSRERFEQGMTYAAYRAQMTRNQDRFDDTERTVQLRAEDVTFFQELAQPLNVLVLAEDWCGDVIANLPVLGRLAQATGKLNLRIFLRDQNPDLMDRYLNAGQYRSIPVFVLFDADFRELGHWIERPAKLTAMIQEVRAQHFATAPELAGIAPSTSPSELSEEARSYLRQVLAAFRAETREFSDSEVIRELRMLIAGAPATTPATNHAPAVARTANGKPMWQPSTQPPAAQPVKVKIVYCAECGYEPQTLALASALMVEFRDNIAALELIPWHGGMFDVVVDGELVHSMVRDGGFPQNAAILAAVHSRLGVPQAG
jgi:selT/selW/selH-like putative selenoprotein